MLEGLQLRDAPLTSGSSEAEDMGQVRFGDAPPGGRARSTKLSDNHYVTGLRLCLDAAGQQVLGARVEGRRIYHDGRGGSPYMSGSPERTGTKVDGCETWTGWSRCPGGR